MLKGRPETCTDRGHSVASELLDQSVLLSFAQLIDANHVDANNHVLRQSGTSAEGAKQGSGANSFLAPFYSPNFCPQCTRMAENSLP
jgi:hypothetical protein